MYVAITATEISLTDSSGLPEIAEADELNESYDLPHNNWLAPDKVLYLGGC